VLARDAVSGNRPQDGLDAGGLRQVGTAKRDRFLRQVAIGRHDHDGYRCELGVEPCVLDELLAIHDRHHQIDQDQTGVERGRAPQLVQSFDAVAGRENVVTVVGQELGQRLPNRFVVLDDENDPFTSAGNGQAPS
jgi:hypothetical protein